MVRKYRIGVVRGDGIGPEIVEATLTVLESLGLNLEFVELEAGYSYYRKTGKLVEDGFFEKIEELDAVLKGPLYTPHNVRDFRSINVMIRQNLNLYANVRPFKSFRGVSLKNFNIVLVRENTEGLYAGVEGRFGDTAISLRIITERGSRKISEFAFRYARDNGFKKVTAIHKSNILKETDGLFREVFFEVAKKYPEIEAEEMLVDTAAFTIVRSPEKLQVLVTPNLYGDILADELAAMVGSLGLCGSAQIGDIFAVFEPVHGVAFDIAGKGIANPIGEIMSAQLMLNYLAQRYSDERLYRASSILGEAVRITVEDERVLTLDLGGNARTEDVARAIVRNIDKALNTT